MKSTLVVGVLAFVGGAVIAGAGAFLLHDNAADSADLRRLANEFSASRVDSRRLADRVDELERVVAGLARAEPSRERVVTEPHMPAVGNPAAAPDGSARPDAAFDPRRLLAEYVASFANGGEGSDFFRMAVAAYAWQLRAELQAIVVDSTEPDALRLQVMAMFDGGSFRGDAGTIDALLKVLRDGGWEQGATQVLAVLTKIGDRRTAELLEGACGGLEPLRVRAAAWNAIAALCGGDADSVLLRLFERERDPEGHQQLIALFRGTDLAATLRAYELASHAEHDLRLAAAGRVGRFREESFVALVEEWKARETADDVRERLGAALEQQKQVPAWHELQATGPPNVEVPTQDDRRAWASQTADGGAEWLELTYATALRANRVTIYETCVAGAVVAVDVMDESGTWSNVWSGDDPLKACGPFEVQFTTMRAAVKKVRVRFDTKRTPGWNEIDAVELAGPDGREWASGATASSRYGSESWGNEGQLKNFEETLRTFTDQRAREVRKH